jgi:hypothetical protein
MAATVERITELRMPIDGIYQSALPIPVEACQRFSVHPLTWLRYLGFTIHGTEGHISTAPGREVDYYKLIYSPVFITMYHKASHISASKDPPFTFNFRATSA